MEGVYCNNRVFAWLIILYDDRLRLDYLAGEESAKKLNKRNLQRLEELELLGPDKKQILYDLIDTYIRDAKTKITYAAAS